MDYKSIIYLDDELNMINNICSETMNELVLPVVDNEQKRQIIEERKI